MPRYFFNVVEGDSKNVAKDNEGVVLLGVLMFAAVLLAYAPPRRASAKDSHDQDPELALVGSKSRSAAVS
jgi:hypothetical protein